MKIKSVAIENFRGYLSLDLLDAFISEKSIKALKE